MNIFKKRLITKRVIMGYLRDWLLVEDKVDNIVINFDLESVKIKDGRYVYCDKTVTDFGFSIYFYYIDNIMRGFLMKNQNKYLPVNSKNLKKLKEFCFDVKLVTKKEYAE